MPVNHEQLMAIKVVPQNEGEILFFNLIRFDQQCETLLLRFIPYWLRTMSCSTIESCSMVSKFSCIDFPFSVDNRTRKFENIRGVAIKKKTAYPLKCSHMKGGWYWNVVVHDSLGTIPFVWFYFL